jgi:hypothetical protein
MQPGQDHRAYEDATDTARPWVFTTQNSKIRKGSKFLGESSATAHGGVNSKCKHRQKMVDRVNHLQLGSEHGPIG